MAIVDVIASCDQSILSLVTEVHTYAKRAVSAGAAASADTVAVTVKDVRRPVAFNSPVAQRTLEVFEGRKSVALVDDRHIERIEARVPI